MVLLGHIQNVVIEECTKILTKAQWASKFSISGHVSSSHKMNPIRRRIAVSALIELLAEITSP